jgi:membrane protease YdiL (CAAX protease family)
VIVEAIFAAAFLLGGVPLGVYLLRAARFDPSDRLPPGGSAWPLVLAVGWGLLVWMMVPAAYLGYRGHALRPPGSTRPTTAEVEAVKPVPPPESNPQLAALPPRDVAFIVSVPHLAMFFALLVCDLVLYRGSLRRLGFGLGQLPRGLFLGLASGVVFIPMVVGGSVVTEWVYRVIHFSHPTEHDLLHVLGLSPERLVRIVLVVGATVIAPLAEELLFRGHIQTIVRHVLGRLGRRREADEAGAGALPAAPPARATWGAILLTSALFAAIHDPWTWPPIFLLSLFLGWLYERTGNLWAAVGLHAAFNTVMTLIFLQSRGLN